MKAKKEDGIKKNKKNSASFVSTRIEFCDRATFSVGKYYDNVETKPPSTPKPRNNKK